MSIVQKTRSLAVLLFAIAPMGCSPDSSLDDEDDASSEEGALADMTRINIAFNGAADQFGYYDDFYQAEGAVPNPGPRGCHWYTSWDIALQGEGNGTVDSRAYLERWLHEAEGHCRQALISFKAKHHQDPPSQHEYKVAFDAFVETDWQASTGFTGSFAFTPWNEPNNPADDGNGLGQVLPPKLAATYYLTARKSCGAHGCEVAAGDLASNGDYWNDYEINCASDVVAEKDLCKKKNSHNPDGKPASYLDVYKNYLVNQTEGYGLGKGFRPEVFAYHGWHDVNRYLDAGAHCTSYDDCVTRRLLVSLGGSWKSTKIWDTEVGSGQHGSYTEHEQACGAAFLLRLTALDARMTRLYYTRLHGGVGQLLDGHQPRKALEVLASRSPAKAGTCK